MNYRPARILTLGTVALAALIWMCLPGSNLSAPASSSSAVEMVILSCQIGDGATIPNEVLVTGPSSSSSGAPALVEGLPCAETIAGLLRAGYRIQTAQSVYTATESYYLLVK